MNNDVRRIGVLIPPGNIAMERELPIHAPDGVVVHFNRMSRPGSRRFACQAKPAMARG